MYSILIDAYIDTLVERDRPRAQDPKLCAQLVDERDVQRPEVQLLFHIGLSSLQQDVHRIRNVSAGRLASERFIDVLKRMSVPFTAYPTTLVEELTGQPFPNRYYFWISRRIVSNDAVDWEHSEEYVDGETGVRRLTKLVLRDDILSTAPLLFVTGGHDLVHKSLQMEFEAARITGIAFAPLDAIYAPLSGIKRMELERKLQEHPNDWVLWYELSGTFLSAKHFGAALEALDRALALNPGLREAWERRGSIFSILGQLQDAREALSRAIRLQPQPQLRIGRKNALYSSKSNRNKEIPINIEHLLELSAWVKYCAVLQELDYKEEALEVAHDLVQTWNQSPLSWYALGKAQTALGHHEEALQAIERGFAIMGPIGPDIEEIHGLRGEILYHLGRYREALAAYQTGLASRPNHRGLYVGKIKVLHALGRHKEAIKAERELQELEQEREENLKKRPR